MVSIRIGVTDTTTQISTDTSLRPGSRVPTINRFRLRYHPMSTRLVATNVGNALRAEQAQIELSAHINHSTIIAPNSAARNILRIGLAMIRTARR